MPPSIACSNTLFSICRLVLRGFRLLFSPGIHCVEHTLHGILDPVPFNDPRSMDPIGMIINTTAR